MALPLVLGALPWVRWLAYALALVAAAGWGAWRMHEHDAKAYNALTAEYAQFKGGVGALADAAKIAAEKVRLEDRKAKELSDAKNTADLAAANARIARLRQSRNDSRGGSVSAAPAGSRCPDGAVCFAVAEYQRTLGDFDSRARRLADSCSKVELDFNTAHEWANRRTP